MVFTLSRAQLEAIRTKLAAEGTTLSGDAGHVSSEGVTLGFTYVEPTLTISVLHKPMLFPESLVESKIKDWFATT